MTRNNFYTLLGVFLLTFLSACGGGGSSSTGLPPTSNHAVHLSSPNADQEAETGVAFEYDVTQNNRTFTDADGDSLTYTVSFAPDQGDFSASNGFISGRPSVSGIVTVTVKASDGGTTATDVFNIHVAGEETADVVLAAPNADQTAVRGSVFTYDATQGGTVFTDADGDDLTYTVTYAPERGDFTDNAGVITGTPSQTENITVTITATDGNSSAADTFLIRVDPTALEREFGDSIDLENLENYANQEVPSYIGAPNQLRTELTDAGATLGRVLFYDVNLSVDNTISCASCHQQENAFGDLAQVSDGVEGGVTGRHSMRLINTLYEDEVASFWDERAFDVQDQVTRPIADGNEHGFSGENGRPDFDALITKLSALDYYQELFTFAYGDATITRERMAQALSQFVNSIISFDSRFDEGYAQVLGNNGDIFSPFPNYSADENEGKNIYMSGPQDDGAGCRRCHADPVFSVFEDSGHIGVIGVAGDPNATDLTNTKSPSMRDLFKPNGDANGPFMHDGSLTTMREVIDHYDAIPVPTAEPLRTEFMNTIDSQLIDASGEVERLDLTDQEKSQLEDFLRTLAGNSVYTDSKWSDPFQ